MLQFFRSLTLMLLLFELLARQRKWQGMTWLSGAPLPLLAGIAGFLFGKNPLATLGIGLATAPLSLPLHLGLASARNHRLNPMRRLDSGTHPDRRIERVDIPMPTGHMPALLITPHGQVHGAVCVLHGSGCDKTYYAWRIADAFATRGITTLLVDLDGHGESPRIQRHPQMLENASEGVAWLRQHYDRVGLVGVSLGGCLAARAVADGVAVAGLALLEAPPYLHYTTANMRQEALALTEPFLFDLLGESTAFHLGATIYDLIKVQSGPRIRAEIGTVDLIARLDLAGSLQRISAPLLLMYGERDAIVRPDQAALVRSYVPDHAAFHMVPGASHLTLILHPLALARLGEWMHKQLVG
jgi:pimeloyl-ACP methyl ester carboxylesterase